jgi:hypothetical protein
MSDEEFQPTERFASQENRMERNILKVPLVLLTIMTLSLSAMGAQQVGVTLNAKGPITLTGITCPAGTTTGDQCYSISGSLTQGKTTVALSGTLDSSGTSTTGKNGTCYAIFNSSTETATLGTEVKSINVTGQACIKTSKGVAKETLTSGAWIGSDAITLETLKGSETWTVTPTDDLSTTSPLAGTGTLTIKGTPT